MDNTEILLKELSETNGISGYEGPVREVVRRHLAGYGTFSQDNLGSLICEKRGTSASPRVMIAAHMDEIGFLVRQITPQGFIQFVEIGGFLNQVELAQRVVISTSRGDVFGVLGSKPPHLLTPEARAKMTEKRDMYIDIGASSAEEVRAAGVRLGDPVTPVSDFAVLAGGRTYLGKAWDDRVACAWMIETMRKLAHIPHPNTVFGVGTVQEEVGLRGAMTSAQVIDPDVAIALEIEFTGDTPGFAETETQIKMGAGPCVILWDRWMIPNMGLRDLIIRVAEENSIPLQISSWFVGGATDGATIHLTRAGVPTIALSVPCRNVHTHAGIIHRADYDHAVRLLTALIQRLDAQTVREFCR
jgi:putative aminopeptidase FrvX